MELNNNDSFILGEWYRVSLFVHEFGHSLGCPGHDDEVKFKTLNHWFILYNNMITYINWHLNALQTYEDYDYKLIMNSRVGRAANIWSPRAKKLIREQESSQLLKKIIFNQFNFRVTNIIWISEVSTRDLYYIESSYLKLKIQ